MLGGFVGLVVASFAPNVVNPELDKFSLACNPSKVFSDCAAIGFYYIIYKPASWAMIVSGYMFDALLPLSMSKSYIQQDFVTSGWTTVRDIANMAFIFILLYTGIMTMIGGADWKRPVINVIIIALVINFSLFFTKIVIDAGNILAFGVYEQISTPSSTAHTKDTGIVERNVSGMLVGSFGPQNFMNAASAGGPLNAIFAFFVAAVVGFYVSFIFIKASLLLVGRLLMFWYLMIASPIAFISLALPQTSSYFSKWLDDLLKQSFFLVIFLFLIYMIAVVLKSPAMNNFTANSIGDPMINILIVLLLKATLIFLALQKTLKFAESWSGEAGKLGATFAGKALGLTAGGVALAGAGAVRGLSKVGGLAKNADGTPRTGFVGAIGRGAGAVSKAGTNLTFDARNISAPKWTGIKSTLGEGISKAGGIDVGTGTTRTLTTMRAEAVKKAEEKAKQAAEKPMSIAQSVARAEKKAREKQTREATQKTSVPSLEADLRTLTASHRVLGTENHDTFDPATGRMTVAGTGLRDNLSTAEDNAELAKDAMTNHPGNRAAASDYMERKTELRTAQKSSKDYQEGAAKIEMLEDKIEKYKAL